SLKHAAPAHFRGRERFLRGLAHLQLPEIDPVTADHGKWAAQLHVPHAGTVDIVDAPGEIQDLEAILTAVDDTPVDVVSGSGRRAIGRTAVQVCIGLGHSYSPREVSGVRYRLPSAMARPIASMSSSSPNGFATDGSSNLTS